MKKQRYEYLTMVLVLLAVVALMPMKVWAVNIPAPQTTATVHLGVNDPPATATLNGWYCSDTDLRETVTDMFVKVMEGGTGMEARTKAFDIMFLIEKGWPHNTMMKSPVKTGLDAPAGGSKTYNFKCCYTKSELDLVAKKVETFFLRIGEDDGMFTGEEMWYKEIDEWAGF